MALSVITKTPGFRYIMEMRNEEAKTTPKSFTMKGGDGPLSYYQNSRIQKGLIDAAKEMTIQAIADKFDMEKLICSEFVKIIKVADFGCSTGPNTFFAMENILEAVEQKYVAMSGNSATMGDLEFQVFFNDLATNDFNTLFKSLPPSWPYFVAGVPGSFYGRLFPKASIHIGHSSTALYWLSKVPEQIVDTNSPAYNKGSIYCTGKHKEVATAFATQFESDMETFLNARAEELVGGGLMILLISGTPDGITVSQTSVGKSLDVFGSCLVELTKKGLINEERMNSFNLPIYFPTVKELKRLIERNGHFSIEESNEIIEGMKLAQPYLSTQDVVSHLRAAWGGTFEYHFGNEIVDELFASFAKNHAENNYILYGENVVANPLIFMILKRK